MRFSGNEKIIISAGKSGIVARAFVECEENIEVEISSQATDINRMAFVSKKPIKVKVIEDYRDIDDNAKKILLTIEDGQFKKKEYGKEEYIRIKDEAREYKLTFEYYHNYYEFTNSGRDEYRETIYYSLPFIPDDCILVENGSFYGAFYVRKDDKKGELAVIKKDGKDVVVDSDYTRSEWGSMYATERAFLVKEEDKGEKTLFATADVILFESL